MRTAKKVITTELFDIWNLGYDVNGNRRYVLHFLNISLQYARAVELAHKIGGRKYTGKWYGGGIEFRGQNLTELINNINSIKEL